MIFVCFFIDLILGIVFDMINRWTRTRIDYHLYITSKPTNQVRQSPHGYHVSLIATIVFTLVFVCNCTALERKVSLFKRNTRRKFSICFCLILTFGLLQKNVTTCPFAKIIQNESLKDNICSIAMSLQQFFFLLPQFGFVGLIFRSSHRNCS